MPEPVELPEDGLLLRGGLCDDLSVMADQAIAAAAVIGEPALTVWGAAGAEGETEQELIARLATAGRVANRQVRVCHVGPLLASGFGLRRTLTADCHFSVLLGTVFDEGTLRRFTSLLSVPMKNPTWPTWRDARARR